MQAESSCCCVKAARCSSESSTSATAVSSGCVGGNGSDILNSADLKAVSGECSESLLSSGAGGLGLNTTSGSHLDMHGVDADLLAGLADVLSCEHSYTAVS